MSGLTNADLDYAKLYCLCHDKSPLKIQIPGAGYYYVWPRKDPTPPGRISAKHYLPGPLYLVRPSLGNFFATMEEAIIELGLALRDCQKASATTWAGLTTAHLMAVARSRLTGLPIAEARAIYRSLAPTPCEGCGKVSRAGSALLCAACDSAAPDIKG